MPWVHCAFNQSIDKVLLHLPAGGGAGERGERGQRCVQLEQQHSREQDQWQTWQASVQDLEVTDKPSQALVSQEDSPIEV